MIPDPFANTDPAWQPFKLSPGTAEFSQADLTPTTLKGFLRSDEVQKAIAATQPPPPAPTPERGWSLANIPTFPRRTLGSSAEQKSIPVIEASADYSVARRFIEGERIQAGTATNRQKTARQSATNSTPGSNCRRSAAGWRAKN